MRRAEPFAFGPGKKPPLKLPPQWGSWDWRRVEMANTRIDPVLLSEYKTQNGETLGELTTRKPLLLVFLRHFG